MVRREDFLTMINARFIVACLIVPLLLSFSFAQEVGPSTASSGVPGTNYLPLSAVKEGMRGTARTVFRGTEPEEFNIEILGVVPGGVGPKQDLIIGRLSGGPAERTAVFAGMSGSPVYIGGKLVGAISYSFAFAKEPICGITPIEQMISIFEQKDPLESSKKAQQRSFSFSELSAAAPAELPIIATSGLVSGISLNSALMAVAGQSFQRIATPVTFTGFTQQTLEAFGPQLMRAGLLPVATVGGSAPITPLKKANEKTLVGGTSVSMQLSRGDYSVAAAGTVTYRDGKKIYAFGHPFLNLGSSDLPMSESHVITVVPNLNNAFKIAVPDAMVGSMTQDRATGVYGSLGQAPRMIPVKINVRTSRGQNETLDIELTRDDFLTPLLLNMSVYNTIVARERGLGDTMVEVSGKVKISGHEPLTIDRRFAGGNASQLAAAAVATPVQILLQSSFDDLEISGIEVNIASVDGSKTGVLERILVDRTQAKAGETVEVQAYARTQAGRIFVQRIPVRIPTDTPAGPLSIVVGDGLAVQKEAASQQFVPRDVNDLIRNINAVKMSDRLYVLTVRTTQGAIIGSSEMPNLPPSVLATLNNERTAGGIRSVVRTVVGETTVPPAEFIISGQQSILIEIVK